MPPHVTVLQAEGVAATTLLELQEARVSELVGSLCSLGDRAQVHRESTRWLVVARQWDETPSKLSYGSAMRSTVVRWNLDRLHARRRLCAITQHQLEQLSSTAGKIDVGVVQVLSLRWGPEAGSPHALRVQSRCGTAHAHAQIHSLHCDCRL